MIFYSIEEKHDESKVSSAHKTQHIDFARSPTRTS